MECGTYTQAIAWLARNGWTETGQGQATFTKDGKTATVNMDGQIKITGVTVRRLGKVRSEK